LPCCLVFFLIAAVALLLQERKYLQCVDDLKTVTDRRNQHKVKHDSFRKRRLNEFFRGFKEISIRLKEMYQMITIGGDAELSLVDTLDPFSEGIEFRYDMTCA
jgi:structural maintenance of chromosome 4